MKEHTLSIAFVVIALSLLSVPIWAEQKSLKSDALSSPVSKQLLLSGYSKKKYCETAADHNGSLLFKRSRSAPDTIHIVAFRVEFKKDTSTATTGNGLFGINMGGDFDTKETKYYNSDTVYKYDDLPHDSAYFDRQLQFVQDYYSTVSHGKLHIDFSIFPSGAQKAYALDTFMTAYGPGEKKPEEAFFEYYNRETVRLLRFVRDAVTKANSAASSPFAGLHRDASGDIRDSLGRRTVFLLIHAGSSYLTDGGKNGSSDRDSPFDMIDAFIPRDLLAAYKDTLALDSVGIGVKGAGSSSLLIDEIMMVSETANQDGLNFGIHGIIINQLARQIGIPDLYSTWGGVSGIGAFCIMDYFGYLAGQGFVPPWPSAWVRAFMGWEQPVVVSTGQSSKVNLKAVCLGNPGDTTIALVPINNHEYYLLENRQRSLVGGPDIFTYDTESISMSQKRIYIDGAFPLNLKNNVLLKSDTSNVILRVKNYDACLPASGVLVWHIDERVIRDHLKYDILNVDSAYRAVALEEADGVNDIGFEFQNALQVVFDAGGAEDVFPHYTANRKLSPGKSPMYIINSPTGKDSTFLINSMGPWTKPSTHSNDGGQTYLNLTFDTAHFQGTETSKIRDYYVYNAIDSVFRISIDWDLRAPGWPKRTITDSAEALFDPVACDIYKGNSGKELVALSNKGKLYVWPSRPDSSGPAWFGNSIGLVPLTGSINRSLKNAPSSVSVDTLLLDTVHYFDIKNFNPKNPQGPFTFPTVIGSAVFIPLLDSAIDVITGVLKSSFATDSLAGTIIPLSLRPSTYVCKLEGNFWAIGADNGAVFCADTADYADRTLVTLSADTPASVCAIAALSGEPGKFVCIQSSGVVSLCSIENTTPLLSTKISRAIPPFSIVTGDINHDDTNEIIICDSRKGMWCLKHNLSAAMGWENAPNDWASSSLAAVQNRASLPINLAPPALADINSDGCLEIIAGGFSGIYALNFKGVPISGWPVYLDNRFYRGNVNASPVVVSAPIGSKGPLVVFSSPTGENETFEVDKIISTNKKTGIIIYRKTDGSIDSGSASASFIDSALVSDSTILNWALYGGLVDAVDPTGSRPLKTIGSNNLYSQWPLSIGSSINAFGASLVLDTLSADGSVDIVATGANGWVHRWKSRGDLVGASFLWKQTGFDAGRSFAYAGSLGAAVDSGAAPLSFFSWPNPTDKLQTEGRNVVNFKYKFSGKAQ
jgi:hypothetical protein